MEPEARLDKVHQRPRSSTAVAFRQVHRIQRWSVQAELRQDRDEPAIREFAFDQELRNPRQAQAGQAPRLLRWRVRGSKAAFHDDLLPSTARITQVELLAGAPEA